MSREVYVDHAGAALPVPSQLSAVHQLLLSGTFGNPRTS